MCPKSFRKKKHKTKVMIIALDFSIRKEVHFILEFYFEREFVLIHSFIHSLLNEDILWK